MKALRADGCLDWTGLAQVLPQGFLKVPALRFPPRQDTVVALGTFCCSGSTEVEEKSFSLSHFLIFK